MLSNSKKKLNKPVSQLLCPFSSKLEMTFMPNYVTMVAKETLFSIY